MSRAFSSGPALSPRGVICTRQDGQSKHTLGRPTGVAVSGDLIFVADVQNGKVYRMHLDGTQREAFACTEIWEPYGLAVGTTAAGNRLLFCADSHRHRIVTFVESSPGSEYMCWGEHGEDAGSFDHPRGLAVRTYLPTYLLTYLPTYLLTCLPTYLLTYLLAYLLTYLLTD